MKKFKLFVFATMVFVLSLLTPAMADEAVAVRVADHGDFSRMVFDLPSLTAYSLQNVGGKLVIDLDSNARPVFSALSTPIIKAIKASRSKDNKINVEIITPAAGEVKDYRIDKKIVIDIYSKEKTAPAKPAEAKTAPAVKTAEKKAEEANPAVVEDIKKSVDTFAANYNEPTPAKSQAEQPKATVEAAAAPEEPQKTKAEIKTEVNAETKIAAPAEQAPPPMPPVQEPVASKETPPAPAAAPAPEEKSVEPDAASAEDADAVPDTTTKISLPSLSSNNIAVFTRANILWIVTDTTAVMNPPMVSGPFEKFVPKPQTIKFAQGTAYAYKPLQEYYPKLQKDNVTWDVILLPKAEALNIPEPEVTTNTTDGITRLSLRLKNNSKVIKFHDPIVGDDLEIALSSNIGDFIITPRNTPDFEIMPSYAGIVVRPIKDNLQMQSADNFILMTSPNGLNLSPRTIAKIISTEKGAAINTEDDPQTIFDFPNWSRGGIRFLQKNKIELQHKIAETVTPEDKVEALVNLAKLYFANNYGQETLGILDIVLSENPDMTKNPDFMAIRGAANAMAGRYKEALQDLSFAPIQNNPEINLWAGFAAAATEQWKMANRYFPKDNRILLKYPDNLSIPLTIYMAESTLRVGNADAAKQLLDTIDIKSPSLAKQHEAAIKYLQGEIARQKGDLEKAEKIWQTVAEGKDRLYHTKASLSLALLLYSQNKIQLKDAIDRIDSLRFAWRGDGLEVEVLRNLGELKAKNMMTLSGLEDLQKAVDLSDRLMMDSTYIKSTMAEIVYNFFTGDTQKGTSNLEAISIYNRFNYLVPEFSMRVKLNLKFVDNLIAADLLTDAEKLLEEQIDQGTKDYDTSTKLAVVYLLDNKPSEALQTLSKIDVKDMTQAQTEEVALLRARAQSKLGSYDAAIATLANLDTKNVRLLRADIVWQLKKWIEAAQILESTLADYKLAGEELENTVLNTAVAWKLAGNDSKLLEVKQKYDAVMQQSTRAPAFKIITRNNPDTSSADKETINKMAGEVDVFKSFLDGYKKAK